MEGKIFASAPTLDAISEGFTSIVIDYRGRSPFPADPSAPNL
jgi:hypothetical protein